MCIFASTQLDIEKDVKKKQKENKCANCHFYTKSKEEIKYHTVKKHAQSSSKYSTVFVPVIKNSQVTSLSGSIGEKNM